MKKIGLFYGFVFYNSLPMHRTIPSITKGKSLSFGVETVGIIPTLILPSKGMTMTLPSPM